MGFDAIINLRLYADLKARLIRLARQPENRGRDMTDLCRIALEDYCNEWEAKLKLQPITPAEVEELSMLLADRAARPTITPRPPVGPVTYSKGNPGATGKTGTPRKPRGPQN